MNYKVIINIPMFNNEVPELRQLIGWGRRDKDYPIVFERCNFWAGVRDENRKGKINDIIHQNHLRRLL